MFLWVQFVSVVQGLVRAARQLRQLHLDKKENCEIDVDSEQPQGVRSTLLRRLLAAASSVSVSEPAAQLLSVLDIDAAASNDKLKLFHCRDGRFPEVSLSPLLLQFYKINIIVRVVLWCGFRCGKLLSLY